MNTNILNAMNGVAIAAANAKDTNTVSILQSALLEIALIPTTYDATATSTTAFLNPVMQPYNGQILDVLAATAKQLGLTGKQLGG